MSISGFIEWLPEIKALEKVWVDRLHGIYKDHGFACIETAAVELYKDLERKGEIDKEIYLLTKKNVTNEAQMALHYDLTIPFARYVAENYEKLPFPFKRHQIQKVWRGERPQFGRYREFYQADIDIIDNEKLSIMYDAEVLVLGIRAMNAMGIPAFRVGVSNRKIFEGYLLGTGIADPVPVLRIIDKLDKLGRDETIGKLMSETGLDRQAAEKCIRPCELDLSVHPEQLQDAIKTLGVENEQMAKGVAELMELFSYVRVLADDKVLDRIRPSLSFVRGFDYYTGSIFEGEFVDGDGYGSICSGGRYDNLMQGFSNRKLPGVGFSIGLTRIMAYLEQKGVEQIRDYSTNLCDVYAICSGADAEKICAAAGSLIGSGMRVSIIHADKLKKGLKIADKAKVKFVLFDMDGELVVRNLQTGDQMSYQEFSKRSP